MKTKLYFIVTLIAFTILIVVWSQQNKDIEVEITEEVQLLADEAIDNLVFIPAGTYLMGPNAVEVSLDGFYMSKFRIMAHDFFMYADLHGIDLEAKYIKLDKEEGRESVNQDFYKEARILTHLPASMDWSEADGYCKWLGKITGLEFGLPKDEQWEYVIRNLGENEITHNEYHYSMPLATDSGIYEGWINSPDYMSYDYFSQRINSFVFNNRLKFAMHKMPSNYYPPNPLGIYELASQGFEWMADTYNDAYINKYKMHYTEAVAEKMGFPHFFHPSKVKKNAKVIRGTPYATDVTRYIIKYANDGIERMEPIGARCVVNQSNLDVK